MFFEIITKCTFLYSMIQKLLIMEFFILSLKNHEKLLVAWIDR
jgi:hypothetical protein